MHPDNSATGRPREKPLQAPSVSEEEHTANAAASAASHLRSASTADPQGCEHKLVRNFTIIHTLLTGAYCTAKRLQCTAWAQYL